MDLLKGRKKHRTSCGRRMSTTTTREEYKQPYHKQQQRGASNNTQKGKEQEPSLEHERGEDKGETMSKNPTTSDAFARLSSTSPTRRIVRSFCWWSLLCSPLTTTTAFLPSVRSPRRLQLVPAGAQATPDSDTRRAPTTTGSAPRPKQGNHPKAVARRKPTDELPTAEHLSAKIRANPKARSASAKKQTNASSPAETAPKSQKRKTPLHRHQRQNDNRRSVAYGSRQPSSPRGPWRAPFHTSRETQQKIQEAGELSHRSPPALRATAVLRTLFDTPEERCNAANLVCALTLSAKLRDSTSSDVLRKLLWRALAVLRRLNEADQLSARQLCNAAWAIAKHFDRDGALLPPPIKQTALSTEMHLGHAEEWILPAELEEEQDPALVVDHLVDELALNLASKLQQDPWIAKEGELSMTCWAYGVLRERRRPAGWKVAPQVGVVAETARRDRLAVTFEQWDAPLASGSTEECIKWDPPGPTDELLDDIGRALCQLHPDGSMRIQSCRWSELAHVAWSHASHGWSCTEAAEDVLLAIASEAAERLHDPQRHAQKPLSRDIAQLMWSLGILQSDNFRLTAGLVDLLGGLAAYTQFEDPAIIRPFKGWSCPDIVQVPLALAHARIDDQALMRELYSEAKARIGDPNSPKGRGASRRLHAWEISILLWAQARLHLTEEQGDIFSEFPKYAIDYLLASSQSEGGWEEIGIGGQEQANLIWSLAVLEEFQASKSIDLLQRLFQASQDACRSTGVIQLEHAHQLWQALYLLEEEAPRAVEGVEAWFRKTLEAKWLQEKARPKDSSARHRSLSQALADMGVAHFNEHDEDIDVAIVLKRAATWTHETDRISLDSGMRVAVEFDGPNHFTRILDSDKKEAPRPLGHSVMKYRLLKRQGWTVVRVPYYEFDRIPFWASMERQRYIQRLLKTHSDLRFSSVDISEYKPPIANRKSRFQ